MKQCSICGAEVRPDKTTVTVDTGDGIVVVRCVPASVCSQCGEQWIDDETTVKVEKIVERARKDKTQIEVIAMAS